MVVLGHKLDIIYSKINKKPLSFDLLLNESCVEMYVRITSSFVESVALQTWNRRSGPAIELLDHMISVCCVMLFFMMK